MKLQQRIDQLRKQQHEAYESLKEAVDKKNLIAINHIVAKINSLNSKIIALEGLRYML